MKNEDDYNDFEKGVLSLTIKLDENFDKYLRYQIHCLNFLKKLLKLN